MGKVGVSKEVLLDGAQMNLSALIVGTMSFLKQKHIPIKDWVTYIGKQFEDSWEGMEGEKAENILEHLLTLEVLPLGVEVTSSNITGRKAEAVVTPLPSRTVLKKFGTTPSELLSGFGVTREELASFYAMYEPAAKAIGLRFTHKLDGAKQILGLEGGAVKASGSRGAARK
jgi:hypothetical protein